MMYPIQAGQSSGTPGQLPGQQAAAMRFGNVRPLFGEEPAKKDASSPRREARVGASSSAAGATAARPVSGQTPDGQSDQVRLSGDAHKEHNLEKAKAMFFSSGIPFLTCFLYLLGPVTGPLLGGLVGAPIAYLSGKHGRKLHAEIKNEEVHSALNSINDFAEKLKTPEKLGPGELFNFGNELLASFGLVKGAKMAAMTARLSQNPLGRQVLKILRAAAQKLKLGQLMRRIGSFPLFKPVVQFTQKHAETLKIINKEGGHVLKEGAAKKAFEAFGRGLFINMRVANADSVGQAMWAGATGVVAFAFKTYLFWLEVAKLLIQAPGEAIGKIREHKRQQAAQGPAAS